MIPFDHSKESFEEAVGVSLPRENDLRSLIVDFTAIIDGEIPEEALRRLSAICALMTQEPMSAGPLLGAVGLVLAQNYDKISKLAEAVEKGLVDSLAPVLEDLNFSRETKAFLISMRVLPMLQLPIQAFKDYEDRLVEAYGLSKEGLDAAYNAVLNQRPLPDLEKASKPKTLH